MARQKYRIIYTDDRGGVTQREELDDWAFLNYTRIVNGLGILNIGLPFAEYGNIYRKDFRIEVYRTHEIGKKRRLENVFFMRKNRIYTREEDNVTIAQMSGEDPIGLLRRRVIPTRSGTAYSRKTDNIDDMMKEIVREAFGDGTGVLVPVDEDGNYDADRDISLNQLFRVQPDASLGSSQTKSFAFRNVLSVLKDLHEMSIENPPVIYFDMVPITPTIFEFQTFQNQRGADNRFAAGKNFFFSLDRGNLGAPSYEDDSFDEKNAIYVGGQGEEDERAVEVRTDETLINQSIWGRAEAFRDARAESTAAGLQSVGDEELAYRRPVKKFIANFLDVPGSNYGVEWDFGDRVTARYADLEFDPEIKILYVSVNDEGAETIQGRNEFGEFEQSA